MAKNDNIHYWYISISPEIQEHPKLNALRWAGKENIVLTLYDIIYYAARQNPPGIIEYEDEFPTIEDQLSLATHHQRPVIIDTLKMFEPMGWIVPISKEQSYLLAKLAVPVYPAFTYDKTGGAIRLLKNRHDKGIAVKDYIPTIEECLNASGTNVPKTGTNEPRYNCTTYNSNSKSSSSLVSTQGNFITTSEDSSSSLNLNINNKLILDEFGVRKEEILKATLKAEQRYPDATPQNRSERINRNITAAALQIKTPGKIIRKKGLIIDAIQNNYQL